MKYRKKPVTIEAMELTRKFFDVVTDFVGKDNVRGHNSGEFAEDICYMNIKTAEGIMAAFEGYYIIKAPDPKGGFRFWPVDAAYFAENYEKVEEN